MGFFKLPRQRFSSLVGNLSIYDVNHINDFEGIIILNLEAGFQPLELSS
jgi:hypothetical protein